MTKASEVVVGRRRACKCWSSRRRRRESPTALLSFFVESVEEKKEARLLMNPSQWTASEFRRTKEGRPPPSGKRESIGFSSWAGLLRASSFFPAKAVHNTTAQLRRKLSRAACCICISGTFGREARLILCRRSTRTEQNAREKRTALTTPAKGKRCTESEPVSMPLWLYGGDLNCCLSRGFQQLPREIRPERCRCRPAPGSTVHTERRGKSPCRCLPAACCFHEVHVACASLCPSVQVAAIFLCIVLSYLLVSCQFATHLLARSQVTERDKEILSVAVLLARRKERYQSKDFASTSSRQKG